LSRASNSELSAARATSTSEVHIHVWNGAYVKEKLVCRRGRATRLTVDGMRARYQLRTSHSRSCMGLQLPHPCP
jgi:hypothetical protein